jgi:hypothetical protein
VALPFERFSSNNPVFMRVLCSSAPHNCQRKVKEDSPSIRQFFQTKAFAAISKTIQCVLPKKVQTINGQITV